MRRCVYTACMSKLLLVSAKRDTLRAFAESLLRECEAAGDPPRESIEVTLGCRHNGSGPQLAIRFDNDDCEGDHIEPGQVLWEDGD